MSTVHGFGFLNPNEYPKGASYIRLWDVGVTWKDINTMPDMWNWSRLDYIVDLAEKTGVTDICYVLGMTPPWAAKNPNADHYAPWIGPGSNSAPKSLEVWDKYVWNVATRYRGRIKYYQVWNEPQLKEFWHDISDLDFLATMTKRAQKLIARIDPQAKIVAAPILPRPSSGGIRRGSRYLIELKKLNWPVDIFSCHVYPEPRMGPARWKYLLERVVEALSALDAPEAPLWVTETNYNLLNGEFKSRRKIQRYIRTTNKAASKAGVSRIYWYAFGTHSNPNVFGIKLNQDTVGFNTIREFLW